MWDHDCGCVPVVDAQDRLVGIVTDRDICMAAYTQGVPLAAIAVERVMSPRVISCTRGDDLETAHRLMRTHEIHRIPVADSRGRLVGILSLSDMVNYSSGDTTALAVEIAATLAAIRQRRKQDALAASVAPSGDEAAARESTKAPKKAPTRRKKPPAQG
jgi:CBS-domain-containing membrane protein